MNNCPLFSYSILTVSLFIGYPTFSVAAHQESATQSAKASIEAPRQIILNQPGQIDVSRIKQYRTYNNTPLQSTGYWVEKGETIVVELDYQGGELNPKMPAFTVTRPDDTSAGALKHAFQYVLKKGVNRFTATESGIVYIFLDADPIPGDIIVNIKSGGRPFARFVSGVHSAQDYQQMLSHFSDVPYVELVSDRIIITLRRAKALQFIDSAGPQKTLDTWDKIVTWAENQYGLVDEDPNSIHQRISHRFHWKDGIAPPEVTPTNDHCSGYMNSGSWRMITCTDNAIADVVNYSMLTSEDGWGGWHELGHQFQMKQGLWDGMSEVSVNLTSMYVQRELHAPDRLENEGTWDKYVFPYLNQTHRDYHKLQETSYLAKAAMLWQLDLTFGKDFYARLGKMYRELPEKEQPATSDEKIQRFIFETSRMAGYNLKPFFEKWGLPLTPATKQALESLSLKALNVPIWENRDKDIRYDLSEGIDHSLSKELRNPGAESGKLTGWHPDKGQFRVVEIQDGIKPASGHYFFTARQNDGAAGNDSLDQMSQTISLDTSIVNQGQASASLKFKSNGWGDGDYGTVFLIARDSNGNVQEEKQVDTKGTANKWLDNEIIMPLPTGSITLTVQVQATKKAGAMSDVHFDDFVLKVDREETDTPENTPPVAKASLDPTTLTGAGKITLSAADSYDPDGDSLTYKWKQVAGPTAALNASNAMTATVQLDAVKNKTDYQFEVTVTDSHNAFSSYRVSMTQNPETISTAPAWDASKTYSSPCDKVFWQGKTWMNGWWTKGSVPGSDGTWGVWRETGTANMHSQCK